MKRTLKLFLSAALVFTLSVSTFVEMRVEAIGADEEQVVDVNEELAIDVNEEESSANVESNEDVAVSTIETTSNAKTVLPRAVTYTVTYDANGGTGNITDPTAYEQGAQATVKTDEGFINPGFVFTGWNTAADGNGDLIMDAQQITMTANVTLYAQWAPDLSVGTKFTITYDANGGTGTVTDATEYDADAEAVIKASTGMTKAGFTFKGWNTAADGTGVTYAAAQTVTMMQSLTLFAQWEAEAATGTKFTVSYDANGGTGTVTDATEYDENAEAIVKAETGFNNPGFVFTGWNTAADGSGDLYMAAQPITMTANVTLFAQWAPDLAAGTKFTVTYDANGGTGTVTDATEYDADAEAIVKADTGFSNPGFVFTGWNTAADGSGDLYMESQPITMTANVTLFAQWAPDLSVGTKFTLTYDANGGTGTVAAVEFDANANAVASDGTGLAKAGFVFAGWNTAADGTGTAYAAGAQVLMDNNITLFAQWKAATVDPTVTTTTTTTTSNLPQTGAGAGLPIIASLLVAGLVALGKKF